MDKIPVKALLSPVNLLALGFGSGLTPKAPGTAGTLLGWLLALMFPLLLQGWVIVVASLLGVYICHQSAKKLAVHDHPGIVWDEFCGIWLTLFLAPVGLAWSIAAFVLFRFFDIVKPWPISYLDSKVQGGLGIMVDDLLAAIFAGGCLFILKLIPSLTYMQNAT